MKIRHFRKKVVVFMFSIILVLGVGACSLDTGNGLDPGAAAGSTTSTVGSRETATPEPKTSTVTKTETSNSETSTVLEPEVSQPETGKTMVTDPTAPESNEGGYSDIEEISVGDPIIGIVDRFAENLIVIRDAGDPDLVYYFSTKNAQVVEGDSPIVAGDMVAISYRGVMGDEEHPGEAVKVVAESMMYQ